MFAPEHSPIDALQAAGCEKIFEEKASGAQRERPQLKAAFDYMRAGDTLVVWKLDRLARSLKQLIETGEDLAGRGIAFRSLTEAIDTMSAGGKLIFHIFASLAEFERSIIRERTMAGLSSAKERGRLGGRPSALKEADIAAAKALLLDPDISTKDVAKRLGVSVATLYRHIPAARSVVTRGEPV
uniref:Site-specific DNA recombinase n=1 Tax=Candidatus Kentrum sp. FM TaxID=2126340 RepID=A0A450VUL8_9GAMM|nr:MAG: Site-specific DNA recombinase [Candidatus Kentron sp. FM]VFJ74835.1 MAG: Site-specific DNA recombinase [Candidatus Kentron sp. FM]VFK08386.1 MAG: Site-specific DNA recombinase [Candidatus Kentron sp. FM]